MQIYNNYKYSLTKQQDLARRREVALKNPKINKLLKKILKQEEVEE